MKSLLENIQTRRSYYQIGKRRLLEDEQIEELVRQAVLHTPSGYNSQTTRVVVLFGKEHESLWRIVEDELRKIVPKEKFAPTEQKMQSFANGYGTILFFEDPAPWEALRETASQYADKFTDWAHHTSGMHQYAVWMLLEDAGYGVSVQHYNPLIDDEVKARWNLPSEWKLIAQMPFGSVEGAPGEKVFKPVEERLFVFR